MEHQGTSWNIKVIMVIGVIRVIMVIIVNRVIRVIRVIMVISLIQGPQPQGQYLSICFQFSKRNA